MDNKSVGWFFSFLGTGLIISGLFLYFTGVFDINESTFQMVTGIGSMLFGQWFKED